MPEYCSLRTLHAAIVSRFPATGIYHTLVWASTRGQGIYSAPSIRVAARQRRGVLTVSSTNKKPLGITSPKRLFGLAPGYV